ncbi:MAG: SMODS domain-containing nucleotidyltransferase [Bacillota bacterium]
MQYQQLGKLESLCIAFFDLVDSTYLKKKLGQTRGVDLAVSHNRLAAGICQQFRGRVVKHIGDSIMVVFDTPLEGMLAALEFISSINKDRLPFRTKAGLTHGIVTRVDIDGADYLGQAVDRSARLTGQALPNQVLTDETTMDIIKPFMGDFSQIISRFLGVRDLKGIGKVPVYEVAPADSGFINEDDPVVEVQVGSPEPVKSRPAPAAASDARLRLPPLAVPQPAGPLVVDEPLGKVLECCTMSRAELDSVAIGYQNLSHLLEKAHDMHIRQVVLSGSFARGTMVRPLAPVDVIAVMAPPADQQQGVKETLQHLDQYLSRVYPGSTSIQSERCVNLSMEGIEFSVIPVLAVIENGQGRLLTPSQSGGFWVPRNPALPEQWLEQAVKRNGPVFLPFLLLIKAWQRINCNYINSFHLELLTDLIASQTGLELSFASLHQWFQYAYQYLSQNKKPFIKEPGQSNLYIDDYMYANSLTFNRFSRILTESYNLARQGIAYLKAGEPKTAMTRWKALFGPYMEEV